MGWPGSRHTQRRPARRRKYRQGLVRMKLLVTGTAGFIGFHVAKRLVERGDEVIGVDSVNDYYDVRLKHARLALLEHLPNYSFHHMNVADREGIAALFQNVRPERVIHLA